MDPTVRTTLHTLIISVLYLLFFVIVLPSILRVMDQTSGKIVFGVLVGGGVILAIRLRQLSRLL